MKKTPLLIFFLLLAGLFSGVNAFGEERTVETTGVAAIVVDPVSARDRAIVDARRRAVEEVSGVEVDARAVLNMGLSEDDWLRVRSYGVVKKSEILSEGRTEDRYTVRLKSWVGVGKGAEEQNIREFLSQRSFIVLGIGPGVDEVVSPLKSDLVGRGFFVYDDTFLGIRSPGDFNGIKLVDAGKALADFLIFVETKGTPLGGLGSIKSFEGSAKITLTELSSSMLKASAKAGGRVFGLTEDQAFSGGRQDQFPQAVALPVVEKFLAEMDKVKIGGPRSVRVKVLNPKDSSGCERFFNTLKELRWVADLKDRACSGEEASASVEYGEKVVYLAADLDFTPAYSVLSYSPSIITATEE